MLMEVSTHLLRLSSSATANFATDIHLRNVLLKLPSTFDHLSVEEFYEEHGEPQSIPVTEQNGKPLPLNVPANVVIPIFLGKPAEKLKLSDAQILLSDFGEAFAPDLQTRLGKDSHIAHPLRPPEARFEPEKPLSYSADVWSLALAIWEILGMKAIFSMEFVTPDEAISQQIEVLGPMPKERFERWEERAKFFDDEGRPTPGRELWPPIDRGFEEGIQKYRRKRKMGEFGPEETIAIVDLIRRMLAFRPEERPSAEAILQSEWMVKWVMPDYHRSRQMERRDKSC
jgi:serine/threonine protein kinase